MSQGFHLGKRVWSGGSFKFWGPFLLVLIFSACTPLIRAGPPPTPQVLILARPLALNGWDARIHTCAKSFPQLAIFIVDDSYAESSSNPGITLYLGNPTKTPNYTYLIDQEDILIVANKAFPLDELSLPQLQALMSGAFSSSSPQFSTNPVVQFWTYPYDDQARIAFDQAILTSGSGHINAQIAPDPSTLLAALVDNPAAFGYLPSSAFLQASPDQKNKVKLVNIDEKLAASLRQPVLAIFTSSPDQLENAILQCLQGNDYSSTTSSP
jgi:hypothetical protein